MGAVEAAIVGSIGAEDLVFVFFTVSFEFIRVYRSNWPAEVAVAVWVGEIDIA